MVTLQMGGLDLNFGAESSLPKDVRAVLPRDPLAQLELAHQICCYAYTQRVAAFDNETLQLRQSLNQKTSHMKVLESRLAACQLELQEAHEKAVQASEERGRLVSEKAALANSVRKLNRDVSRLENFRRNLLHSLQSNEFEARQEDDAASAMPYDPAVLERGSASRQTDPRESPHTERQQHRPTAPYSTPPNWTNGGSIGIDVSSPLHYSRHDADVSLASGNTNGVGGMYVPESLQVPVKTMSPPRPSAKPMMAASAPNLDGKEFFRQARTRLSNDSFSAFLQAIKELNGGKQTREDTLQKAYQLFGAANSDLYRSFEQLLSRHLPPM